MIWPADVTFPRPLTDLRVEDSSTAQEEREVLLQELSTGHPLYGHELNVVAIGPIDELIVEVSGNATALVYLVHSGQPEMPPYPLTEMFESPEDVIRHVAQYEGRSDLL